MKFLLPFFCLLLFSKDGVHATGLRHLKKEVDDKKTDADVSEVNTATNLEGNAPDEKGPWEEEKIQWNNLSLDDVYAPSSTPTAAQTDLPTNAQTFETASDLPSQVPTLAPSEDRAMITLAPTEAPSTLSISYETFSGGEPSGKSFRIQIDFDDTPHQNAWHLFQGLGPSKKEIYAKDFGTIQSGGRQITTFEDMTTGNYTFLIADINADGIGQGKISIYDGNDTQLWESEGDFGFLIEKPFLIH